ncbi:30S ribosomal protein S4 [bacterium]|nr:30S ribosomal protein S4 [bacterium]
MARYIGPVCRLCRREGVKLFLKGERCYTPKCALEKKNYAPGQHGQQQRRKLSNYGVQLREKQKLRRIYGLNEQQFLNYFTKAASQKGATGENFLVLLERRLDNVIFRLGLASSRSTARQIVRHGHVTVDGQKVNIPSYQVKVGQVVSLKEKSKAKQYFVDIAENAKNKTAPKWLEADYEKVGGKVVSLPAREDIDTQVDELLVVEFYSK